MSIDPKFVELTADVHTILFYIIYTRIYMFFFFETKE